MQPLTFSSALNPPGHPEKVMRANFELRAQNKLEITAKNCSALILNSRKITYGIFVCCLHISFVIRCVNLQFGKHAHCVKISMTAYLRV